MEHVVVGITGGSGVVLGYKAVRALTSLGFFVELVMSKAALLTAQIEMGEKQMQMMSFIHPHEDKVMVHRINNLGACVSSGTYRTCGMLIIPCSMATLSAIALGLSDNLLRRAADVTLKERRRLVVVPRESPLNEIHLKNMLKLTRMGAMIVPPVPSWYTKPTSLEDVENFIVGRAIDSLGIQHDLYSRWGSNAS